MDNNTESHKILYRTKNYDLFSFFTCNRKIVASHVQKFVKALSRCNLLHEHPITVDKEMRIIDGQHRFTACKELGIEVIYTINKNFKIEDMQKLNSCSKDWTIEDSVHFFAELGNIHYKELMSLKENYKCSMSDIIVTMGFSGKNYANIIKDGRLNFNIDEKRKLVEYRINFLNSVSALLNVKGMGRKDYISQWTFKRGLIQFLNVPGVDEEVFLHKIEKSIAKMAGRGCAAQYVDLFKEIYNHGNRNRIS